MATRPDPYLDAGMHAFIINTAKREYWRVANWCDLDDLIQEGYLCYAKCRAKYRKLSAKNHPLQGDRKWMMSLVKTTFIRHIYFNLAGKMMHGHERAMSQLVSEDMTIEDAWDRVLPPQPDEMTAILRFTSLPSELKDLISILANDTKDQLRMLRRGPTKRSSRETSNEFYCRLLGLDPRERDVLGELREYLLT